MKNPLLLVTLGVCSFGLAAQPVSAQSSFGPGAAGNSPFSRVYAAPSNPPSEAPTPAMQAMPGGYAAAGINPGAGVGYYNEPIDPNHKLNRGDRLSFRVVEDRDVKPPDPLVVTDSGEVNIPLVGPVPAAGKSVAQLTSEVKARLEREYYYHATVIMGLDVVAPRPSRGRVYISGAVRTEGAVELPLDEPLTVSKAISKAGGFKDIGNQRRVRVLRKGDAGKAIEVDVKAVLTGKSPQKDVTLEPGDTVVVPERGIIF